MIRTLRSNFPARPARGHTMGTPEGPPRRGSHTSTPEGEISSFDVWGWPGCLRVVHLSPRRRLPICLPVPTPRFPNAVWLDVFLPFCCYFVFVLLAPREVRRPLPRALVFILCAGMRRPKNAYYPLRPPPLPSFALLFPCLLLFSSLFFPPSVPRAGCGALNTHLFVSFPPFFAVFLLLSLFPLPATSCSSSSPVEGWPVLLVGLQLRGVLCLQGLGGFSGLFGAFALVGDPKLVFPGFRVFWFCPRRPNLGLLFLLFSCSVVSRWGLRPSFGPRVLFWTLSRITRPS